MNLLASAGYADDDRLSPTLVSTGERLVHDLYVANAFEGKIDAAAAELDHRLGEVGHLGGIQHVGCPELAREGKLLGIGVDPNDALGTRHHRSLNDRETDAAQPEDRHTGS